MRPSVSSPDQTPRRELNHDELRGVSSGGETQR